MLSAGDDEELSGLEAADEDRLEAELDAALEIVEVLGKVVLDRVRLDRGEDVVEDTTFDDDDELTGTAATLRETSTEYLI